MNFFGAAAWPLYFLWHYYDRNRILGLLAIQIASALVFIEIYYAHSHSAFLFRSLSLARVYSQAQTLKSILYRAYHKVDRQKQSDG